MAWPKVSVLFFSYDRIDLLEKAVHAFRQRCRYPNLEVVVADDGSLPIVVNGIQTLPVEIMVFGPHRGIGANFNRGLQAATGEYILCIEQDFFLTSEEPLIERSIEIMRMHEHVGLVRLHHDTPFPNHVAHQLSDGTNYSILEFDQPPMKNQIYIYSNQAHIKRAEFHERAGWYAEGLPAGRTEDEFCRRFLRERPWQVATFWRTDIFHNAGVGNSTRPDQWRERMRAGLQSNAAGRFLTRCYERLPRSVRWIVRGTPQRIWQDREGPQS